jgi:hypothetical protein
MSEGRRHLLGATLLALPLMALGCGGDDHPNEPRIPAPVEVSASVDDERVSIGPTQIGGGLANVVVSNQSDTPVTITFEGPESEEGNPVAPNAVGTFKFDFVEGTYEVSAGAESKAKPATFTVGAERPSAQNQLLLP